MKLLVGLGNPGEKYSSTRHNIGFMVVERLAERFGLMLKKKSHQGLFTQGRVAGESVALLLPQTFMNLSGASVGSAVKSLGCAPGDLVVVHDDIDLPFGSLRIKFGGGHGGQNGIRHIKDVLGTGDFVRLKIGIGRPVEGGDVSRHVLSAFCAQERQHLARVIDEAVEAVEAIVASGLNPAMNQYNGKSLLD